MFKKNDFMKYAIKEACKALKKKEVPVGAVIIDDQDKIIAKGHNLVETKNNATNHAEKIVIEKALKFKKTRYLNNCDLWVTLKPCEMCLGIIKLVRIKRLFYGADFQQVNTICKNENNFSQYRTNSKLEIYPGLSEEKCKNLIKSFFEDLR